MNKNTGLKMILAVISVSVLTVGTFAFADFNDLNMNLQSNMMGLENSNFDYDDMMDFDDSNYGNSNYSHGSMMNFGNSNYGHGSMMNYGDSNYSNGNMMNFGDSNYGHGSMMDFGDSNYGHGSMMNYGDSNYDYGNMMNYGDQSFINADFDKDELKDIDELKANVKKYLENYSGEFIIEDIFVYSNSNYYFSITEEETGKGAMELLVNPITGDVYPEYGPNMMWNTKYGMHGNNGSFGMMNSNFNYPDEVKYTTQDALEKANDYLSKDEKNLSAEIGGHSFYGYYTFHVNEDENLAGMISVNSYTGEVWYHNWHGDVIKVISEDH